MTLDEILGQLADLVADRVAARLHGNGAPAAPDPTERWLTPRQAAELLQVPLGYCYKHQRELGGVHVSPRVLRFPESVLRRRLARA